MGTAPVHYSVSTLQPQPRPPSTPQRLAVIGSIADRVVALSTGRLRVAIDGPTAAGKSNVGDELAERVARLGRPVLRACLDDFKRPWRDRHLYDRESAEGYYRNAYDYPAVIRLLLEPSGRDGTGSCALCSFDPLTQVDHSSLITRAANDAVTIVDGVFAFRPEINDYWDYRIWLDVDSQTSVRRASRRDASWAGSDAEALMRTRYLPSEQLYLCEVAPLQKADVIVDNTDFDVPRIV